MGENPQKFNYGDLCASGGAVDDSEEFGYEFGDRFTFTISDVRKVSQLEKGLKEAQKDLAAANAEITFYKRALEESREERMEVQTKLDAANGVIQQLREELELEYNGRRMAKNKCFWIKQTLVRTISNLGNFLRAEGTRGGDDGDLEDGDQEMLKGIPAQLELLIGRLEDAKVKEDFRGFGVALDEVMKRFRLPLLKLRGADYNAGTVDDGVIRNGPVEPAVIPTPILTSEVEEDADVDVVSMETEDVEQELLTPESIRHVVKPSNNCECVCGFTSNATNVQTHVWRLTRGRHTTKKGSFVCHVCGDRLMSKPTLKGHLACHKSPKPIPRVDSNGSNEDIRVAEEVVQPGEQGTSKQVTNSGSSGSEATWPSSSVVISNTQEQQLMEIDGDGLAETEASRRSLGSTSTTASGIKHEVSRWDSQQCLCGFRSKQVRLHISRVTLGSHTNGKPHACEICGDHFQRPYSLRKHLERHESPPNAEFRKMISPVPAAESQTETEDNGYDEMPVLTQQCTPTTSVTSMPSSISQNVHQSNIGPNPTESPPKSVENHYEVQFISRSPMETKIQDE